MLVVFKGKQKYGKSQESKSGKPGWPVDSHGDGYDKAGKISNRLVIVGKKKINSNNNIFAEDRRK